MRYIIALGVLLHASTAFASTDMSSGEFWTRANTGNWTKPLNYDAGQPAVQTSRARVRAVRAKRAQRATPNTQHAAARVHQRAAQKLGSKWAPVAVKLAYVESRFNHNAVGPKTRHGRAQGILQVMPGTARAMGYNPSRLREFDYGLDAGLQHMALCLQSGVQTEAQMSKCHVAGVVGWKRRLNPSAERYKYRYVAMVNAAPRWRD
tara:strand:+ start:2866 stop:3483 length:618 start_codon:yes stop_codon:yes gene_type:complete